MKIKELKNVDQYFHPLTIEITIENADELASITRMANVPFTSLNAHSLYNVPKVVNDNAQMQLYRYFKNLCMKYTDWWGSE